MNARDGKSGNTSDTLAIMEIVVLKIIIGTVFVLESV